MSDYIKVDGELCREVILGRGKFKAIINAKDAHLVWGYNWHLLKAQGRYYARALIKGKFKQMHQMIIKTPHGHLIDHRNGNGLDNRRSNIRPATSAQNSANRDGSIGVSRFKGVTWNAKIKEWRAVIARKNLGGFDTEIDAAKAYDKAARKLYGKYARFNFPRSGETGCGEKKIRNIPRHLGPNYSTGILSFIKCGQTLRCIWA